MWVLLGLGFHDFTQSYGGEAAAWQFKRNAYVVAVPIDRLTDIGVAQDDA